MGAMPATGAYGADGAGAFPATTAYRALRAAGGAVQEPARGVGNWPYSERHVQCAWYDPRHRPQPLVSEHGETLWVDDPGIWNQEAGPDFLGAVVRVGPGERRIRGDVEVHVHPAGWNQHAHLADPRYREVRIHVTWFPGALPAADLPPGAIQVSLARAHEGNPRFSLEAIDPTAYPYAARATAPPCAAVLHDWHPDRKAALLDAAGQERMRLKAQRMALRIRQVGEDQALYEEFLAALGYKHNKAAGRRLAALAPQAELRDCAEDDPLVAYAILLGVAGLLPPDPRPDWDPETRRFVRRTWDAWWRFAAPWDGRRLGPGDWRLAGLRPANHPRRRLMAAARLFTAGEGLARRWSATADPDAAAETLTALSDPYWDRRLRLGGRRQNGRVALLGRGRIDAVLLNLFVPFRAAISPGADVSRWLRDLPIEEDNVIIRRTAHCLFGPDHPPSLYRTGLRRQGLIQIFQDFCLNDRSRCTSCPLPRALRENAR